MRNVLLLLLIAYSLCGFSQSSLPVVYLTAGKISTTFSEGTFSLGTEGTFKLGAEGTFNLGTDTTTYTIDIRQRGASALKYTKKSFAIKFKDEEGNKLNLPLLGMRDDNSWILDAMAIDKSRMRNRVSTDLWNDFSSPSHIMVHNEKAHNGTHGCYVEVYLNDEYLGLYCLTEKIDRKQLGLKKFKEEQMRGVLYKSFKWEALYSNEQSFYDSMNNNLGTWRGWEISYPDISDGEPGVWNPLADLIRRLSFTDENLLPAEMPDIVDLPVWIDYILLIDLLLAEDNVAKNQYIYFEDITQETSLAGICPWDMDHAWGRDYKADKTDAEKPVGEYYNRIMDMILRQEAETLKNRYQELRESAFHADSLKNRFLTYYHILAEAGALEREKNRWDNTNNIKLDFEGEMEYICQWIDQRLLYLDKKYAYKQDGLDEIAEENGTKIRLYNLAGQYITTLDRSNLGKTNLPAGIYIITPGNKKIRIPFTH